MSVFLPTSRRQFLQRTSCGFGSVALAGLLNESAATARSAGLEQTHHRPTARRVIFLFMRGGPSHMDTFDHKPQLSRDHGKKIGDKDELLGSPWKFHQRGESGLWVSELFPHVAKVADELCVIRSMQTDSAAHPQAMPLMHTGSFTFVRPSLGSWVLYGLGHQNEDLPGFITINPSRVFGGPANFGSAFLPAAYQGARIGWEGQSLKNAAFRNVANSTRPQTVQREQLNLLASMNSAYDDMALDGVVESFEMGARMQSVAPQVMDISQESPETLQMYGIGEKRTDNFGRQCLLARRFAEAGVRFIELGHGGWDHHQNIRTGLERKCQETDQPIAALLADLRDRGLLDDTLVVWAGEFGRLPELQFGSGRGHNAKGFTIWMAGGGVKGGIAHGATDDYGRVAVENPVHLYDMHATILHALGLDHERLTYRYSGRDFRLTDVHGRVVQDILS